MTTTCVTCTRPWDPAEEPSGDRERCPDCWRDLCMTEVPW